ncbi:UDP-N-acetylmuramoyl-L-alanyl-D-glutamate--2,6-diaminopimelate ligase [Fibrobacterota bacterium]
MKWLDFTESFEIKNRGGEGNPAVSDIIYDSRLITPGSVFIAIPGFNVRGDEFINDAVKRGAVAVVSENRQPDCTVPWIQVPDARRMLGTFARKLWNIDFDTMVTVGITGTNGKTTTIGFYHNLYKHIYGKKASWMFSTVIYKLGDRTEDALRTTPEASDLLRFIGTAEEKPKALTMEVSSHALELHRVEGFLFDIAVWTNLSQDHLDFHGNMDSYYRAKKKLFQNNIKGSGIAVINIDDKWGKKLVDDLSGIKQVTYGFSEDADLRIIDSKTEWSGTEIDVTFRERQMHFRSHLAGFFNVYNMAALVTGAASTGVSEVDIQKCFDNTKSIPGRMERVAIPAEFSVIVDYAHTPDALESVLSTAGKLTAERVICVFGCGGGRDKGKRPLMGDVVAHNCDEAVVTTDNPRSEKPKKIIDDILDGMPLDFPHYVIPDRREAIKKALQIARKGDSVIVAGKGHEPYQEINGVRHHFDDREVVVEVYNEMEPVSEKK